MNAEIIFPTVPASKIRIIPNWNKRIDYGEIDELLASIAENGVETPLDGYFEGEEFIPSDGHRRQRAIAIGLEQGILPPDFPVKVSPSKKESLTDEQRALHQVTKNDTKPFTPFEFALWCAWMHEDFAYDIPKLSKKTGKSKSVCHSALLVGTADERIRKYVQDDVLSFTNAAKIIKAYPDDAEAQVREIETALGKSDDNAIEEDEEIVVEKKTRVTKKDIKVVADKTPMLKLKALLDKIEIDRTVDTNCKDFSDESLRTIALINDLCFGGKSTESVYVNLKTKK